MSSTLLKLLMPVAGIVFILIVARLRKLPDDALGLRRPVWSQAAIWFGVWLIWAVLDEVITAHFALEEPSRWSYPLAITVVRVLAIGIAGPLMEELFRSLLIFLIGFRLKQNAVVAVIGSSLLWAILHVQYGAATIALIFLDGIILGSARVRSRSVYVPILMHIAANLFSIWESIHGIPWMSQA